MGGIRQRTIFDRKIEKRIEDNLEKYLKMYFEKHSLHPESLKHGKAKCLMCGKPMKAYCKTLDKRLIILLLEIADYCRREERETFNPRSVWANDEDEHHKVTDFQKLQYFKSYKSGQGLIEKTARTGVWRITRLGERFIKGEIQLPKRVWVFNNEVIDMEDMEMVAVDRADERWQQYREDWASDFFPMKYTPNLKTKNT